MKDEMGVCRLVKRETTLFLWWGRVGCRLMSFKRLDCLGSVVSGYWEERGTGWFISTQLTSDGFRATCSVWHLQLFTHGSTVVFVQRCCLWLCLAAAFWVLLLSDEVLKLCHVLGNGSGFALPLVKMIPCLGLQILLGSAWIWLYKTCGSG